MVSSHPELAWDEPCVRLLWAALGLFIFPVIAERPTCRIGEVWCCVSVDHFGFFYSVPGLLTSAKQILKIDLCKKQKTTYLFPEISEN